MNRLKNSGIYFIAVFPLILASPLGVAAGDQVAAGEALFNKICTKCHSLLEGKNKKGPSLYNVVGRRVASAPNYAYSPSMKRSEVVWTEEELVKYVAKPTAEVPCSHFFFGKVTLRCPDIRMTFPGFASDKEAAEAVVAYLKSQQPKN